MESPAKRNPVALLSYAPRTLKAVTNIILPSFAQYTFGGKAANWHEITFLDEPCCAHCGRPFEYDLGAGTLCARCAANPPCYDRARAAFVYNEYSAPLILSFKHGGKTVNLDRFSRQLFRAGRAFWPDTDYLVPVPLHPQRLRKRKFNQAALLAKSVAAYAPADYEPNILFRHKSTPSQGSQTSKGRFRNVQGVFSIPEDQRIRLKDKTIVLVDDVMTTGATLESCTRALKSAGAKQVYALVLARVVRPAQIPT